MKSDSIVKEIASIEYDLFVVNTRAVAVQKEDGKYYTRYFPISKLILQQMITNHGSMGCYQQVYSSNYIRWVCLDFDCHKDYPVDLNGLYQKCIFPVVDYLEKHDVRYLLEFSGRRGIHIWIILDKLIERSVGYQIINRIMEVVPEIQNAMETGEYALDKFPPTGSNKILKVGKQVKFPLSWHKKGTRSFFFTRNDFERADLPDDSKDRFFLRESDALESLLFYQDQYALLNSYQPETKESILKKLEIQETQQDSNVYKRYSIIDDYTITIDEVISTLSKTKVYRDIFQRMKRGQANPPDWLVLLGTFSHFNRSSELLVDLFSRYPNYNVEKTLKNIKKLKDRYHPATFRYLYQLYRLDFEEDRVAVFPRIEPDMTGVDFLAESLAFNVKAKERLKEYNKKENISEIDCLIKKEIGYQVENDEVININIRNKLLNVRQIEKKKIEEYIQEIRENDGCYRTTRVHFHVYERVEAESRKRKLISLDAFDRLVTTELAVQIYKEVNPVRKSYSYRVSWFDHEQLFFSWYSSWGRYIDEIKAYLELPFMSNNYIAYMDIRHCYDNVDMLVIYEELKSKLSDQNRRAFAFLCSYNDQLMKEINHGLRIGVPQGPAYARILTEIHLDLILDELLRETDCQDRIRLFRYVDDIVIICDDENLMNKAYSTLRDGLGKRGLPINNEKSHNYGQISELSERDKDELLHKHHFNYELSEQSELLFDGEIRSKINRYKHNHDFDISYLGYYFSDRTMAEAKNDCFRENGAQIMSSREGRGKYFRQFYRYLLSNSDNLRYAAIHDWFSIIPTNSINFSNFITTMYLMIQERQMIEQDARLILMYFLGEEFDMGLVTDEDRTTVEAIRTRYMVN